MLNEEETVQERLERTMGHHLIKFLDTSKF